MGDTYDVEVGVQAYAVEVAASSPSIEVTLVAAQGPAGTGGAGGAGDLSYVHTQAVPSATWVITHALGKRPAITILDSSGDECEGSIHHDSVTQATVTFSAAFAGVALCN